MFLAILLGIYAIGVYVMRYRIHTKLDRKEGEILVLGTFAPNDDGMAAKVMFISGEPPTIDPGISDQTVRQDIPGIAFIGDGSFCDLQMPDNKFRASILEDLRARGLIKAGSDPSALYNGLPRLGYLPTPTTLAEVERIRHDLSDVVIFPLVQRFARLHLLGILICLAAIIMGHGLPLILGTLLGLAYVIYLCCDLYEMKFMLWRSQDHHSAWTMLLGGRLKAD